MKISHRPIVPKVCASARAPRNITQYLCETGFLPVAAMKSNYYRAKINLEKKILSLLLQTVLRKHGFHALGYTVKLH